MQSTDHDSHRPDHDPSADPSDAPSANAIESLDPQPAVPTKHVQDHESASQASSAESSVEESLHHALSDLEHILEGKHDPSGNSGASGGEGLAEDPGAGGRAERIAERRMFDERSEQYVIPLLDEVVIPGPEGRAPPPAVNVADSISNDDDEPAMRKRLAERLASEIEVIMQDRIEAALETAREEIRTQVRNHLDITLPEIVEELNQLRRRR
ncbi:MAG: hypothetical protein ACI8W7_000566 [Gammaproteobacteria bacterium]|jgi:hypothetical protein